MEIVNGQKAKLLKLKEIFIDNYKCFEQGQTVKLIDDILVLVGMNESGKTAFLEALTKSMPLEKKDIFFNEITDYPRKLIKKLQNSKYAPVITKLVYEINKKVYDSFDPEFKNIKLVDNKFEVIHYVNDFEFRFKLNTSFENFLISKKIPKVIIRRLLEFDMRGNDFEQIMKYIQSISDKELRNKVLKFAKLWDNCSGYYNPLEEYIIQKYITPKVPHVVNYHEYDILASIIEWKKLKPVKTESKSKKSNVLIDWAQIDLQKLKKNNDNEQIIIELESTATKLTEMLSKYWSTNKNLEVKLSIEKESRANVKSVDKLAIRVENTRYKRSLSLDKRSNGFLWFFSLLMWFNKIQNEPKFSRILLIDEPGINLHASAQKDLLKFFEDLTQNCQIIYTTHSPFMIDSSKLYRVRTIEETEKGSIIRDNIHKSVQKALLPLQAALGYNIAQNLLISRSNLLVEGPSDLFHLNMISEYLSSTGGERLNKNFAIIPINGIDNAVSFISLFRGNDLNVICLLDTFVNKKSEQRLDNLVKQKAIRKKNILYIRKFAENKDLAEIEDLYSEEDYIMMYNNAFSTKIELSMLEKSDKSIIKKIQLIETKSFNHSAPPKEYSIVKDKKFSEVTISRFTTLFKALNKLFE